MDTCVCMCTHKKNIKMKKDSVNLYLGEGNGTPLQSSCLENPMDGGASWAAVHAVAKSWTQLSNLTFTFHFLALEKEMVTHSSVLAPWMCSGLEGTQPYIKMDTRICILLPVSCSLAD